MMNTLHVQRRHCIHHTTLCFWYRLANHRIIIITITVVFPRERLGGHKTRDRDEKRFCLFHESSETLISLLSLLVSLRLVLNFNRLRTCIRACRVGLWRSLEKKRKHYIRILRSRSPTRLKRFNCLSSESA